MSPEAVFYSLLTVLAWGTWLAPSQAVRFSNNWVKTAYITGANLVLALFVAFSQDATQLTPAVFLFCFGGGLIWALGGLCAFQSTARIGIAKAMGIWAPLNIIVSIAWGMLLFGEFLHLTGVELAASLVAVTLILAGILCVIFSGAGTARQMPASVSLGIWAAIGAGFLWGAYFIPIRLAGVSMWVAALPMAMGMFAGSLAAALASRGTFRIGNRWGYGAACASGLLWGLGNYGSLRMMELIGTGRGFTLAQLCIVVNALIGIYLFRQPLPGSRNARYTIAGVLTAMTGGILFGLLR